MKKFVLKLSKSGIDKTIKDIRKYRRSIRNKLRRLNTALAKRGYKIVLQQIDSYPMPFSTGELKAGVGREHDVKTARIYVRSDHAIFVEFGTGVVGQGASHPKAGVFGYAYDVNDHGDNGWYYYGDDGKIHWTKGMPSRPFMHNSFNQLRMEVSDIAREVFSKDDNV